MKPPSRADVCVTCGDVADRAVVAELGRGSDAIVELASGERRSVAIELVPDVAIGEVLLVHGGAAIGRAREA